MVFKMKLEDAIKQTAFKSEEERLVINLVYTSGWLSSEQNRFFKRFHISSQQYNVLRILRGQYPNPASVGLIQERMLDKMSNASRLIEKLKQKKLIKRSECSKDRRQVDVLVTQEGLMLLEEIDKLSDEMNGICDSLNLKEKKTLNKLLDKLRK
jgi:DNA-binding MarR family transcriptional regulator